MAEDSFTYTVEDNFGQKTATVAVSIETGSFINASDDTQSTVQGTAVEIDVLANDSASSDNLPIVVTPGSLTAPSPSGTAVLQANGKILYTPASGFTGSASFSYGIKPSGKATPTDTGSVLVTVTPDSAGSFPEAPFAPTSVITATSPADFATKYANLQAGQHLKLPSGNFALPDGFAFNRTFAAPGVAIIGAGMAANGRDPLTIIASKNHTVTKDRHWFHQIQFTYSVPGSNSAVDVNDPFIMRITAANFSMTKCWIRGNRGIEFSDNVACRNNYVGWNRFCTDDPQGLQFTRWALQNLATNSTKHRGSVFAHNYIRMTGPSDDNNAYTIYIGNGHASGGDDRLIQGFRIVNNLFQAAQTGWDKAIYLKCDVEEISGNTIDGFQAFIMRHGSLTRCTPASENTTTTTGGKIHRNWLKVTTCELNGAGHDVRGNYIECPTGIGVKPGYRRSSGQFYDSANDSVFVGNRIETGSPARPAYRMGVNESGATLDLTRGGKLRGIKVYKTLGNAIPANIAAMVHDAAFCDTSEWALNSGLGPHGDPGMAVKLAQTDVGFKVTGQENG